MNAVGPVILGELRDPLRTALDTLRAAARAFTADGDSPRAKRAAEAWNAVYDVDRDVAEASAERIARCTPPPPEEGESCA